MQYLNLSTSFYYYIVKFGINILLKIFANNSNAHQHEII